MFISLSGLLSDAIIEAAAETGTKERSSAFVGILAARFRRAYEHHAGVRVFSSEAPEVEQEAHCRNPRDFGHSGLLFDIHVCETDMLTHPSGDFHMITRALWQVESELENNRRETIQQFNKLAAGNGVNKLFIGPNFTDHLGSLCNLLDVSARHCTGRIFCAEIPFPESWKPDKSNKIAMHLFMDGDWWEM